MAPGTPVYYTPVSGRFAGKCYAGTIQEPQNDSSQLDKIDAGSADKSKLVYLKLECVGEAKWYAGSVCKREVIELEPLSTIYEDNNSKTRPADAHKTGMTSERHKRLKRRLDQANEPTETETEWPVGTPIYYHDDKTGRNHAGTIKDPSDSVDSDDPILRRGCKDSNGVEMVYVQFKWSTSKEGDWYPRSSCSLNTDYKERLRRGNVSDEADTKWTTGTTVECEYQGWTHTGTIVEPSDDSQLASDDSSVLSGEKMVYIEFEGAEPSWYKRSDCKIKPMELD